MSTPWFNAWGDAVTVTGPSVCAIIYPRGDFVKLEIAECCPGKTSVEKFVEADVSIVMSDLRRSAARDYMKQQIEHFGRLIQDSGITPE
jgi:hypothetical protein